MISPVQNIRHNFGAFYIKSDAQKTLEELPIDKIREVQDCANRLSYTNNWDVELSKDSVKIFSNDGQSYKSPFVIRRDLARPHILHIGDNNNLKVSQLNGNKFFDCDSENIEVRIEKDVNPTLVSRLKIALESLSPLKQATEIVSYLENKSGLFDKFIAPPEDRAHNEKVAVKQIVNNLLDKYGVE